MASNEGHETTENEWNKKSGILSDVRVIVSHALVNPTLPKYAHYMPRTPAAIKEHVLLLPEVKQTIAMLSEEQGVSEARLQSHAVDILDAMGHTMSTASIIFTAYAVRKLVTAVYDRVIVNEEALRKIGATFRDKPVILLPTHRSYMDFIVLSYVFLCADIPVPIIAAGEDFQKMAIVGKLLQGCGAFYMRRSFGGDRLYWALFSSYVSSILSNGDAPVEFFIEGTRSRTSKSLHPKLGLLSAATSPFFARKVADIELVPVSISFNERLEKALYVEEMLGKPKPKESFSGLLKARTVLKRNHGHLIVNFGESISLREYTEGKVDRKKNAARPGPHVTTHEEKSAIEDLAYEIIGRLERGLVVMLPAIVSTILLQASYDNKTEIALSDLAKDAAWLKEQIALRKFPVDDVSITPESLASTLETLSPAVSLKDGVVHLHLTDFQEKLHDFYNAIHLAHYRNEVLHVFLLEALALLTIQEASLSTVSLDSEYNFIYKLFSKEFPLRNLHGSKAQPYFERGLDSLMAHGVIDPPSVGKTDVQSNKMTKFLLALLRPFTQAGVVTLETIKTMNEDNEFPVTEHTILKQVQALIEGASFDTTQPECMSASVLGNWIRSFASAGVLVKKLIDDKTVGLEVSHQFNDKKNMKALLQHVGQLARHSTQPFNTSSLRRFISPHM